MFDSLWRKITTLLAFALCMTVLCADVLAGENATIINGDVQLRESFPTYKATTVLTGKLRAGPVVTVIPRDTRIQVLDRVGVSGQEWFKVRYAAGARRVEGWIYAGQVGNRTFVRLDRGVDRELTAADARPARSGTPARGLIISAAYAQDPESAKESADLGSIGTTLLRLAFAVFFVGSMIVAKKKVFCSDDRRANFYSFLTGVLVLVTLGVSLEQFGALLSAFA